MTDKFVMLYKHLPLAGPNVIRLLQLHPRTKDNELSCNLVHVNHGGETRYEALSYAWGPPRFTEKLLIRVDRDDPSDAHMMITENLSEALLALCLDDKPRYLWVDAICINQSNIEEKNHQVAQMGDIYRNAEKVIVWLGLQQDPLTWDPLPNKVSSTRDKSTLPSITRTLRKAIKKADEFVTMKNVSTDLLEDLAEEGGVWCSEPRRLLEAPWLVVTSRQFRLVK